ncbi:MAG: alpha/beta hydrolase [Anaerolineae bacterium]|nr:alpha/beta hydrolase [Anaerolineae bacterium]
MEKVQSKDGTLIAYERCGEGPPLLLVHGTLATHARWGAISAALAQRFTVYMIDRRGRGVSGDTKPYAIEREFEDVAAVVDSIGTEVNVLGHSHGALCVLEAALLTPNIRSLIAYEPPSAPVPDGSIDQIQALLDVGDPEEAVITFVREVVQMPEHELKQWRSTPVFPARVAVAHTIPREFRGVEGYRFKPERFKHLNVPTLLLLGGDSPTFLRTNTENWHAALPDSRIVVMPGQQHIAMDAAPDLFVREVIEFLQGID